MMMMELKGKYVCTLLVITNIVTYLLALLPFHAVNFVIFRYVFGLVYRGLSMLTSV